MTEQLTRRKALGTLGVVSVGALLAACGASDDPVTSADVPTDGGTTATVQPQTGSASTIEELFADSASCTLTPEETQGPYYFDVGSVRSDIREDRDGTDLRLAIRVQDAAACTPIANVVVDIWHCDAEGVYSGFESASMGGPGGSGPTDDDTFLRGVQVTNAEGIVEFLTVYPGWYRGRTVHIHAKVHIDSATALTTPSRMASAATARIGQDPVTASRRPTKPTTVPNRTRRTSRLPRLRQPRSRHQRRMPSSSRAKQRPGGPAREQAEADNVLVADLVAEQEQGADQDQDREAGAGGEPGRIDAEDRAADLQVQRLEERLARAADPLVVGLLEVERVVAGEEAPLQA